jgi:hypothetical protein
MIDLADVLANLGFGVASNAIYDVIKSYFMNNPAPTVAGLEQALRNVIVANKMTVRAATVINMLAQSGAIVIKDSSLFAPHQIFYVAQNGARVFFGGTGTSATDATAISSRGRDSGMSLIGSAEVRQNADGSISFHTGPEGSIGFHVGD